MLIKLGTNIHSVIGRWRKDFQGHEVKGSDDRGNRVNSIVGEPMRQFEPKLTTYTNTYYTWQTT